ncbi:putative glycine hydroxymethyltransferase [Helianthus annuus]|uniref:Glycine hydroxymethyltransferase n=2 Tax=Helianthus annuus TaxID=4232 RepID=A0A9K3ITK2_HELAN|nr:putative glycine hydroxymethyltransferase [Helianthus annuus]KAJ0573877.1 putative glycine hydroxymethyltransferase [Helianthus annuus]KAJ0738213.1 putative glycine hydroxymethyltransferase [Helianthus annuus]KAJ0741107.1 putative glycine hydroxymethyltransferase [Helianthus annuus]KAJ0915790.1 putative glycine hydroxymethyltransferase [Helianthus annuus]
MPDSIEVHEIINDEVFEIQIELVVNVNESRGMKDAQLDIWDYNFVLEHVKPCLHLVLADVSKENDMVETNVCNDGFLVDSMVLNSFAWKPGWVTNHVQVSPRKFVLPAVNTLKFQFDSFAMVITSSNSPFGGKLQETDSGFVSTPPTVTIVREKRNTIGTFGSLLSGSYFGADRLSNFSFDPSPNRIYTRYSNCIIHIFEPIDTVALEFDTSILVHQGLSALRLYFLDDDPNPTDACTNITDKHSAGMPTAWYYNSNRYIDEIETLCYKLGSVVSELHSDRWGVNVQPYSYTTTNFAAYTGLLSLGDRIIGFYTPLGGHMSHGYYKPNGQKVSRASNFIETFSFKVDLKTCVVDFEEHEAWAVDFHPRCVEILVCGWIIFHRKNYKPTNRGVLLIKIMVTTSTTLK